MSLYRITTDKLEPVSTTTFASEKLMERKDLQRLLRRDITPVADDLMVIAEEYGEWEDSNRRIDLLCLSKDAGLAVVEIKRTEDGGHMELQAVRYAAMVSSMTLEQVIQTYARTQGGELDAARSVILEFLQPDSEEEVAELTGKVRIVLVSANYSTELTTAVLWLNRHDLDITCIRLRPYKMGGEILIDATQIIPLPESADYEVRLRAQEKGRRRVEGARQEIYRRFWTQYIERSKARTQILASRTTSSAHWLGAGMGRAGFGLNSVIKQNTSRVECYIGIPGDKGGEQTAAAFTTLQRKQKEIEAAFGEPLDWQELQGRQACRICKILQGGWKSPEAEWPTIQDRMIDSVIKLEAALKKPVQELKL
jgi:hypothetical protein